MARPPRRPQAALRAGEREQKEGVKEEDYYRMEACYGAFERRVRVAGERRAIPIEVKSGNAP